MLWQTGLRSRDTALIGYTNGADFNFVESQANYRPDENVQQGKMCSHVFFIFSSKIKLHL